MGVTPMPFRKITAAALVAAFALAAFASSARAHAFGERYDLPIPLSYFLVGGAATVALSFVVIGLFMRRGESERGYPRLNLFAVPALGVVLRSPVVSFVLRLASVALFVLALATCFFGVGRPLDVLAPTFVWIVWWVGMGYATALFGNLWMLVNPWKITYEWAERLTGGRGRGLFVYPERLDVWPAVALLFVFAWIENVYAGATLPASLGQLIVAYSLVTWMGMAAFGKHVWLRHGEVFSVLFGLFARFSATEVRANDRRACSRCRFGCGPDCVDCYDCFERAERSRRQFNLRPWAVGLANPPRATTGMAAFVLLALAIVSFDGLKETPAWVSIQTAVYDEVALLGPNVVSNIDTLGLLIMPILFALVYAAFAWMVARLSGDPGGAWDAARGYVLTLVPIALAYHLAHYLALLLISGQSAIPLMSDPFGWGWDLLGTANYETDIAIINARVAWYVSVAAIVAGHVVSVYLAHLVSLRRVSERGRALRGQLPMLALMVLYTATSLWIIAQPIVEG